MPPTGYVLNASFGPYTFTACLGGQAVVINDIHTPIPFNPGRILYVRFHRYDAPGQPRYFAGEYNYRNTNDANIAGRKLRTSLYRSPQPMPVLDPLTLPIKWPMPLPVPIPATLTPYRTDHPFVRQTANHAVKRTPIVVRGPTPPGEKETKLRAGGGALRAILALQKVAHMATEWIDVIDALHDALPKEFQAGPTYHDGRWWKASPQAKAKAIWHNVEHMNWGDAALNLAKNEIGDRVLGRANARVDEYLNQSPVGRINRGLAF